MSLSPENKALVERDSGYPLVSNAASGLAVLSLSDLDRLLNAARADEAAKLSEVMEENARLRETVAALKKADEERANAMAKVQGYRATSEARVKELEEGLFKIANWRTACHAYDDDTGQDRRAFDDDDWLVIENIARSLLSREG